MPQELPEQFCTLQLYKSMWKWNRSLRLQASPGKTSSRSQWLLLSAVLFNTESKWEIKNQFSSSQFSEAAIFLGSREKVLLLKRKQGSQKGVAFLNPLSVDFLARDVSCQQISAKPASPPATTSSSFLPLFCVWKYFPHSCNLAHRPTRKIQVWIAMKPFLSLRVECNGEEPVSNN